MKSSKWTNVELDTLRAMCDYGRYYREIAEVLGRTRYSVAKQASELGITNGKKNSLENRYSDADIEKMISLKRKGKTNAQIAISMRKSTGAIIQKMKKLEGRF